MKLSLVALGMMWALSSCSLLAPDPRAASDPRYAAYPLAASSRIIREPGVDNTPLNTGNLPQDLDPRFMRNGDGW